MLARSLLVAAFLLTSPTSLAAGGIQCLSTHPSEKFSVSWSTTRGIGSALPGHVSVDYRDQKYAFGLEARKTEKGTIAMPMKVVGYWVEGINGVRIKLTDDQFLRTILHIEALPQTPAGAKESELLGEAYFQPTKSSPSRKIAVRCEVVD